MHVHSINYPVWA